MLEFVESYCPAIAELGEDAERPFLAYDVYETLAWARADAAWFPFS